MHKVVAYAIIEKASCVSVAVGAYAAILLTDRKEPPNSLQNRMRDLQVEYVK